MKAPSSICSGQIVIFSLDEQEFGIDLTSVKEIVRVQETTRIPLTPDYFMGLMNLRGTILPVMDTRKRIGVRASAITDRSRCVVVSHRDYLTGLLVDDVKEVSSYEKEAVEPPPSLTRSIEDFVPKVIKFNSGKRMVFLLDIERVLEHGIELSSNTVMTGGYGNSYRGGVDGIQKRAELLKRFITFRLGHEIYAFPIEKVAEIIRYANTHAVPDAAPHIKGLLSLRGVVVPVFDLRLLMGFAPLLEERQNEIAQMKGFFEKRIVEARESVEKKRRFLPCPDGQCPLDKWLMDRVETCRSETELNIVQKILRIHHSFHRRLLEADLDDRQEMLTAIEDTATQVNDLFKEYKDSLEICVQEEQRILILSHEGRPYGLLIDKVDEVLSVPPERIERPGDFSDDLLAIAKLNQGEKIVFILDDSRIVPLDDLEEFSGEEAQDMEGSSNTNKDMEEIQLVTFNIGDEEYGIPITSIQEINRLSEITRVPKAPAFVEGVTNLRGEVIPVIDLRKRFNIEPKERDDRTRLVIVNIANKKTGFVVDWVNEVLRLAVANIEPPPPLLASQIDLKFVKGIAKAGEDRMVIVVDVDQVLSPEEMDELTGMSDEGAEEGLKELEIIE